MAPAKVRFRQWRVYAGQRVGSGLWVHVRVFATKREMLLALRAEGKITGDRYSNQTQGAMQGFKRILASGRTTGCVGRVNLYKRCLGTNVVIHEFAHAMFAWADRKRLLRIGADMQLDMTVEEQMCYALGHMTSQFVRRANALGLYDD